MDFSTLPRHLQASYARNPQRRMAELLRSQAVSTKPIQSPWQGIANLGKAYFAKQSQNDLDAEYSAKGEAYNDALARLLSGDKTSATDPALSGSGAQQIALANALKGKEDPWGDFKVVGDDVLKIGDQGPEVAFQGASKSTGPFQGSSMDAQTRNILLNGDPNSAEYQAAYAYVSTPRNHLDQTTGQLTSITPDMSAFRAPNRADVMPVSGSEQPRAAGQTIEVSGGRAEKPIFADAQAASAGFAKRMTEAEKLLAVHAGKDANKPGTAEFMAGGLLGPDAANMMSDSNRQMYRNAQEEWVRAKLRKESGAVIGPEEMTQEVRVYFPQVGDSPEVIAQKAQLRATATQAMIAQSQGAYENLFMENDEDVSIVPTVNETQDTPNPSALSSDVSDDELADQIEALGGKVNRNSLLGSGTSL